MSAIVGQHVVTMENGKYVLDEEKLRAILMNDSIKSMPVALISIAGALRGGKSFILNFFLRYLRSSQDKRANGTWLYKNDEPLSGFDWKNGSDRITTGVLIWPEPFVITTLNGENVAVFLMDTQGTYDNTSTVKDCSTIFALSTLISSFQIYNISDQIREDDLQDLKLFTDYGKIMNENVTSGKAFQTLQFLVRDWMSDDQHAFGQAGGEEYLKKVLEVNPSKQAAELQNLRKDILTSFDKVTCYLMPHPGLIVGKNKFKGLISEIEEDFLEALKGLASFIFSPKTLTKKLINGQPVKCSELFEYFKDYMSIFSSDDLPTPTTIYDLTSKTGILMAYNEARDHFEHNMKQECGVDAQNHTKLQVINIHHREVDAAIKIFKEKKLMGEKSVIEKKLQELTNELNERQKEFLEITNSKNMKAKEKGLAAFSAAIKEVSPSGLEQICVHASDVDIVYDYAKTAALRAFDSNRKVTPGESDTDRDEFIKELRTKRNMMNLVNKQNNYSIMADLKSEYFTTMVSHCNHNPKYSNEEFENEHKKAFDTAMYKFGEKRSENKDILKIVYVQDTYKYNLEQDLKISYELVKQINMSNNSGLFQTALSVFQIRNLSPMSLKENCFHEQALIKRQNETKCSVIQALRGISITDCGTASFDETNKDEKLLETIIKNAFESEVNMNNIANETAVEKAFGAFKEKFDELTNHWYYNWFGIKQSTRKEYLNEAKPFGDFAFYEKRNDTDYHGEDTFFNDLQKKCKDYAEVTD